MADSSAGALSARIDPEAARAALGDVAVRTPTLRCHELPAQAGGAVVLKAESLQRTGSFKLRGALSKIAALGEDAAAGLVTASAGNHGQAVAYAARARELPCEVFMPRDASVSKVASVERLGARAQLVGDTVEDAIAEARARAQHTGAAFVHPFDDPDVIAGQGTVGLELGEDVPELSRVIVPVGGGGLATGIALALRARHPEVRVVGVQADACAPYAAALQTGRVPDPGAIGPGGQTIADGIAVKVPSGLPLALLGDLLESVVTVSEEEIARGMVFLAERVKLVAEGAGAAGVAALLAGRVLPAAGTTAIIVSGGNVDSGLLASILRRREAEAGRRIRLITRVPDRPGGLADLLAHVAGERANLLTIEHLRDSDALNVRETAVELVLETRGPRHSEQVVAALRRDGYEVNVELGAGGGLTE